MREIKFRAFWEKQMRYNAIAGNGQCLFIPNATGEYKWLNIAECHVMQGTELPDKRGRYIYEGDIIKYTIDLPASGPTEYTEEVSFCDGCFNVESTPLYVVNELCEVIGNIYENQELLTNANR